jgi:hypothetical protein
MNGEKIMSEIPLLKYEVLLRGFHVKAGQEELCQSARMHPRGTQKLVIEKAINWCVEVQRGLESGATLREAAVSTVGACLGKEVTKIGRPAMKFIEQFWEHDAAPLREAMEAEVIRTSRHPHVMGGIKDPDCKYADIADQYRPAPIVGRFNR